MKPAGGPCGPGNFGGLGGTKNSDGPSEGPWHSGLFVCGTDTDAGKTVVTAAVARALVPHLAAQALRVCVVKPVQTGVTQACHADASHYAEALKGLPHHPSRTLRSFSLPASPHLAARTEGQSVGVADLLAQVRALQAQHADAFFVLEGAGGVMVPLNAHETLLDFMVALDWPVLLVARNGLGMLNHSLLSLQALRHAGLTVMGLAVTRVQPWPEDTKQQLLLRDNVAHLRGQRDMPPLWEVPHCAGLAPAPAEAGADTGTDAGAVTRLQAWEALAQSLSPAAQELAKCFSKKSRESLTDKDNSIIEWDAAHLWHPYTSAITPLPALEVARTHGTRIVLKDGRELVDGMASWWCAVHGYGQPRLVEAAQRQAGRMAHVMFGGLTHAPAVELGQKLLPLLPEGLEHIFFADSGSVAVEVALKMALQYHAGRAGPPRTRILAPLGGYHGDTLGAMSVCDPVNGMHGLFRGMLAQQLFIPRPACPFDQPFDPASLQPLHEAFAQHGEHLAAVILEPIVQGAGGMWFYHPQYLRQVRALCDQHGVLLIFDEIATGFGRTGKMFAAQWAEVCPDILCLGKALTGGMLSLAATACTPAVAQGICRDGHVFMHGPTFMGNALACAVAGAALDELVASPWQENVARLERGLKAGLEGCRGLPGVAQVRVLGGIGVVETEEPVPVAALQRFFVQQGVWIRPFARLIYLMPPYTATDEDIALLTRAITRALREGVHRV